LKTLNIVRVVVLIVCVFVPLHNVRGEVSVSTTPTAHFTHNFSLGARSDDVRTLQQFLIIGGFLKTSTSTDFFGPMTKTALIHWQQAVGIYPASGFFGSLSRNKMNVVAEQVLAGINKSQENVGTTTTMAVTATSSKDGLPVRLKISKIGVDAGFQYTGLTSAGIMEIPNNITDVGWYTKSTRPGEKGTSIVTGHVAQIRGGKVTKPGVFFKLNELSVGDRLEIVNDKGETVTFVVRESRSYDPGADATDVFHSKDGGTHLNIITCEGTWNATKASYTQRLVVFTDIVSN